MEEKELNVEVQQAENQEAQEVRRVGPGFEDLPGSFPKEIFSILAGEDRRKYALPYVHLETVPVLAEVRREDRGLLILGGVPIAMFEYEGGEGREVRKVSYKVSKESLSLVEGGRMKIYAGIHRGLTFNRPEGNLFLLSLPFGSSYVSVIRAIFASDKPSAKEYLDFRREFLKKVYGGEEVDLKEEVRRQVELFGKIVEENKTDIAKAVVSSMLTTVTTEEGEEIRIVKRNIHGARYRQGKGYVVSLLPLPSGESTPVLPFSPLHRAVEEVVEYVLGKKESLSLNKQFAGLFKGIEEGRETYRGVVVQYLQSLKQTWKELRELQSSGAIKVDSLSTIGKLSLAYGDLLNQEMLIKAGLLPEARVQEEETLAATAEIEELGVEEDFFDLAEHVRKSALRELERLDEELDIKF